MSYLEHLAEDRRLVVLRVLNKTPGYSANDSILHSALGQLGHSVTRDQVRTDLAWLAEQGLIRTEDVSSITVATLTERGADVATGRTSVPGVKRPSPK